MNGWGKRPSLPDKRLRYLHEEAALEPKPKLCWGVEPSEVQRRITEAGLEVVQASRPDFQTYTDLLILYPQCENRYELLHRTGQHGRVAR